MSHLHKAVVVKRALSTHDQLAREGLYAIEDTQAWDEAHCKKGTVSQAYVEDLIERAKANMQKGEEFVPAHVRSQPIRYFRTI